MDIAHRMEADDLSDVERGLLSRLPSKVENYMQPTASSEVVTSFLVESKIYLLVQLCDFPVRRSKRQCKSSLLQVRIAFLASR